MKYVVLGPIGLVEFLFRLPIFVLIFLLGGWIAAIEDIRDLDKMLVILKPYCWELLEQPKWEEPRYR